MTSATSSPLLGKVAWRCSAAATCSILRSRRASMSWAYRLVRDAVQVERVEPLTLKGKAERVPAYRLLAVLEGAPGSARRLDAPMVGRHQELSLLKATFERAVQRRCCQLVTILGNAGVGKSRLTEEFLRWAGQRADVLRGRCLPYGEGITFWPLTEVIRAATGASQEDSREEGPPRPGRAARRRTGRPAPESRRGTP